MNSAVAIVLLCPFAGGAIALAGKFFGVRRLFAVLAMLPLAISGVVLVRVFPTVAGGTVLSYHMGGWAPPIGIGIYLDGMAWIMSALIVVLTIVVGLAALSDRKFTAQFYFFLMILAGGMEGVALAGDLFNLFVSFEIVALAAYVLIAFDRGPSALLASFKYLVLSSVGILFFLFGVLLIYRDAGTLAMDHLGALLVDRPQLAASRPMHLALASLCVGIGVRTAFIPFHTWLPEAHAYAPHPVSALLSGVLIKVSFFSIVRILGVFRAQHLNAVFLWIGAITALVAVVRALAQSDAKKLLAYHSISQMGYVLAAFGAAGGLSVIAAMSHAVNHALFKSLLFLAVGYAVAATGERNLYRMPALGRHSPLVAVAFFVGALSIAGVPPFNGFVSKQLVSTSLSGSPAYYLVWLAGVGTVASFIKLSRIFSFRNPASGTNPEPAGTSEVPAVAREMQPGYLPVGSTREPPGRRPAPVFVVPVVVLALLCVGFGIYGRRLVPVYSTLFDLPAIVAAPQPFSVEKIASTSLVLALGTGVYFIAKTGPALGLLKQVNRFTPHLRSVLLFFFAGLLLFSIVA